MTSSTRTLYPARKGARAINSQDLWATPRVGEPVLSPDGRLTAVTVTSFDVDKNQGRSRIWLFEHGVAEPRPLTSAEQDSAQPVFSPDGRTLAFVRKLGEPKRSQLFLLPLDGGEPEKLTDLPLSVNDPKWLPDGSGLVFVSSLLEGHLDVEATRKELERRDEDPVKAYVTEQRVYRFWDHWLCTGEVQHLFHLDLASRELRDLIPDSTDWLGLMEQVGHFDIDPEGRELAYAAVFTDGEREELVRSAIWTLRLDGGERERLTPDSHTRSFGPRYSPDGARIVYGVSEDPYFYADRTRLWQYDRKRETHEPLLADWELSPEGWEYGHDGRLRFAAEVEARRCGWVLSDAGTPERLTVDGSASVPRPDSDGRLLYKHETLQQPAELWALAPGSREPQRLSHFTAQSQAELACGEVREVVFDGAEGAKVQMYVLLPADWVEGQRRPLVHVIHGGPHGISGDSFHPRWNAQLFAAPGYVTALVNFQGSTSWGQDFAKRIQGGWGDRPARDIQTATDVLVESGLVDPGKMAIAGGSYGGYMVSWLATQTDRFSCAINHAGVFDLLSQYATDITQGRPQSFGGEPWDGIEAIDRWSPSRATAGLGTPMLVIHGEKDYRVPVTQALECYNMLKAKGVAARLVYFPDENHWVLKPKNSLLWYAEVQGWLERWLGGEQR